MVMPPGTSHVSVHSLATSCLDYPISSAHNEDIVPNWRETGFLHMQLNDLWKTPQFLENKEQKNGELQIVLQRKGCQSLVVRVGRDRLLPHEWEGQSEETRGSLLRWPCSVQARRGGISSEVNALAGTAKQSPPSLPCGRCTLQIRRKCHPSSSHQVAMRGDKEKNQGCVWWSWVWAYVHLVSRAQDLSSLVCEKCCEED